MATEQHISSLARWADFAGAYNEYEVLIAALRAFDDAPTSEAAYQAALAAENAFVAAVNAALGA